MTDSGTLSLAPKLTQKEASVLNSILYFLTHDEAMQKKMALEVICADAPGTFKLGEVAEIFNTLYSKTYKKGSK